MKSLLIIVLSLALILSGFGVWGMFTTAGMKEYPEMSGFIPFFSLWGGGLLFITFFIMVLNRVVARRKAKNK